MTRDRIQLAGEALASVTRVIALLERPTLAAVDQTAVELAAATERIQQIKEDAAAVNEDSGSAVKSVLIELRKELNRASLLLRRAWEFQAGISGRAGYTPRGELTAHSGPTARLSFEG